MPKKDAAKKMKDSSSSSSGREHYAKLAPNATAADFDYDFCKSVFLGCVFVAFVLSGLRAFFVTRDPEIALHDGLYASIVSLPLVLMLAVLAKSLTTMAAGFVESLK